MTTYTAPQLRKVPKQRETVTVQFTLGPSAIGLLGADDAVLVRSAYPSLVKVGHNLYQATLLDVSYLAHDLLDRADPSEFGFCHSSSERRIARTAGAKLTETMDEVLGYVEYAESR